MHHDRARILLAFKSEDEHLTRRDIMSRADVHDPQEFQALLDMKVLGKDEAGAGSAEFLSFNAAWCGSPGCGARVMPDIESTPTGH